MTPPPLRQYASTSAMQPLHVTEDTPADLLEGTMDLSLKLPSGKIVHMNVHRSTPMMDLLVQATTAHKINPGGHVIHVVSDNRLLSYKPSTPIGTLDTSILEIVPKNKYNEVDKQRRAHLQKKTIENNIRLKVNLPRNQLAVYRVSPKTLISEVLSLVCKDKDFDINTYEIRHPVNVDEKLRESCTLADYQLQEVCLVNKDYRAPPISVTDLITMATIAHPEEKKRRGILALFRRTKSSTGDSSLSSGSAGERSVSPTRSDDYPDHRPIPRPISASSNSLDKVQSNNKYNGTNHGIKTSNGRPVSSLSKGKKRAAPLPPDIKKSATLGGHSNKSDAQNIRQKPERPKSAVNLSRHSSDSSGYHESDGKSPQTSPTNSEVCANIPSTNLTTVASNSSLSLASRGKRKAPTPPKPQVAVELPRPSAIPEEAESTIENGAKKPNEESSNSVKDEDSYNSDSKLRNHSQVSKTTSESLTEELRSCSPASSQISSVSSLSSIDHPVQSPPNALNTKPKFTLSESESTISQQSSQSSLTLASSVEPIDVSLSSELEQSSNLDNSVFDSSIRSNSIIPPTPPPPVSEHKNRTPKDSPVYCNLPLPEMSTTKIEKPTPKKRNVTSVVSQNAQIRADPTVTDVKHLNGDELECKNNESSSMKNENTLTDSNPYENEHSNFSDRLKSTQQDSANINSNEPPDTHLDTHDIPTFRIVTKTQTNINKTEIDKKKMIVGGENQTLSKDIKYSGMRLDDDDLDIDMDMFELNAPDQNSPSVAHPIPEEKLVYKTKDNDIDSKVKLNDDKPKVPIPSPRNFIPSTKIKVNIETPTNPEKIQEDFEITKDGKENAKSYVKSSQLLHAPNNLTLDDLSLLSSEGVDDFDKSDTSSIKENNPPTSMMSSSRSYLDGYYAMIGANLKSWDTIEQLDSNEVSMEVEENNLDKSRDENQSQRSSISTLCSDADNEVQTRTLSLSSEMSEVSIEPKESEIIPNSTEIKNEESDVIPNENITKEPVLYYQVPKLNEIVKESLEKQEEFRSNDSASLNIDASVNEAINEAINESVNETSPEIIEDKIILKSDLDLSEYPQNESQDYSDNHFDESCNITVIPNIYSKENDLIENDEIKENGLEHDNESSPIINELNNNSTMGQNSSYNSKVSDCSIISEDLKDDFSKTECNISRKNSISSETSSHSNFSSDQAKLNVINELKSSFKGNKNTSHNVSNSDLPEYRKSVCEAWANDQDKYVENNLIKNIERTKTQSLDRARSSEKSIHSEDAEFKRPKSNNIPSEITYKDEAQDRASTLPTRSASQPRTQSRPLVFSISTYKSRAEQTSYDKVVVTDCKSIEPSSEFIEEKFLPSKQETKDETDRKIEPETPKIEETPPQLPNKAFKNSIVNSHIGNNIVMSRASKTPIVNRIEKFNQKSNTEPPITRIKSFHDKPVLRANSSVSEFTKPEVPSKPNFRRLQKSSGEDLLSRASSLSNLSMPYHEIRKAQSNIDLSGVGDGSFGSDMMPGFVPEAQLAQEYMKLQQDFFKWQQQLMQNQHLLHNRVAPLANNPGLHSQQAMRDMMNGSLSSGPISSGVQMPPPTLPQEPRKPREINIPIMIEGDDFSAQDRQNRSRSVPRLSQSVQDVNLPPADMPQYNRPSVPSQRMAETPNISVGAWQERPSVPVGLKQDRDYVQNTPLSRSTQDLSSSGKDPHQKAPALPFFVAKPFGRPVEPSAKVNKEEEAPLWRELQNRRVDMGLPQSDEIPQSAPMNLPNLHDSIPSQNYQNGYMDGPYEVAKVSQPTIYYARPPPEDQYEPPRSKVSISQQRPVNDNDDMNTKFTSVVTLTNDKPVNNQTSDNLRSIVQLNGNESAVPQAPYQLQHEMNRPLQTPIYSQQFQTAKPYSQVKAPARQMAPVVRGFRQSSEERPSSFQSKIISNAIKNSSRSNSTETSPTTPPYSEPISSATPMSSRLVAAVQTPTNMEPPARPSPPRQDSPRSSPNSGPAFANVKLRSTENRYSPPKNIPARASPPKETVSRISPPKSRSQSPGVVMNGQMNGNSYNYNQIPNRQSTPPQSKIPEPPPMNSAVPIPPPPPPSTGMPAPPPPPPVNMGERRTSSGKKIVSCKNGPELDPREELMMAIRNFGGSNGGNLRRTRT